MTDNATAPMAAALFCIIETVSRFPVSAELSSIFKAAPVVSASADSTVRAWDINSGRSLTLTGHTSAVTHIHCDQDCILSASKDATLRLWSVGIAFGL